MVEMSKIASVLKSRYDAKAWNKEQVEEFQTKGIITLEEKTEILGE